MKDKEIWKTYPDYPFIEASNLGRIRTKDRYVTDRNGRKLHIKGRILKQYLNRKGGYMYVSFSVNEKTVHLQVHRVVAICFIPNPNNYPEVNHKDNDHTNNAMSNLEWCTRQYNLDYKKKCGTSPAQVQGHPVFAVDLNTGKVLRFESQCEAARQLGIFQGSISNVVKGKCNKTGGFWFCRADENTVEKTRSKFGDKIANKVEKLMRENL